MHRFLRASIENLGLAMKKRPLSSHTSRYQGNGTATSGPCKQKICEDRARDLGIFESSPDSGRLKVASPLMWRPCPEPPKPREFSCDDAGLVPIMRRKRDPVLKKMSCTSPAPSVEAPECIKIKEDLCLRVQVPGCGKVRFPPKCEAPLAVRDCAKAEAPVSSFSEGYKNPFPALPISECLCYDSTRVC
ncbi:uncharacterized protein LOC131286710 [Anopheles ziemanni]|uniref:uncharacterized protein LOC131271342 n=1 Tax=Anopheles coustani TaxID=139045 RepID=UPI00265805BA|nr:uncharacterized protein LOC131271342 [Anopheles coustani]XP_058171682.1 uncharacterized protein LOC131286710 [Anopheles ziemanni]